MARKPLDFVLSHVQSLLQLGSSIFVAAQTLQSEAKDPVDCLTKDALAKLEATLRRACKPDRKGCLQVPEQVHKMWKKGGSSRRELRKVLLQCGGQKDCCMS